MGPFALVRSGTKKLPHPEDAIAALRVERGEGWVDQDSTTHDQLTDFVHGL